MPLIDIKETDIVVSEIAIEKIISDPNQPRKTFDESKIKELAKSISQQGLISPIVVREDGASFVIVAGERRYRAHILNGSAIIDCIVYTGSNYASISIVENLQREDLKPVEEAQGVKALMDEQSLSQAKVGELLGKSRISINQLVKITSLPAVIQEESLTFDIKKSILVELALLSDKDLVLKLWKKAKKGKLTVSEIRSSKPQAKGEIVKGSKIETQRNKAIDHLYSSIGKFKNVEKADLTEEQKPVLEELKKLTDELFKRLID